jgi:glycosyltransferase involved in cell wall biosynthesis
MTRIVWFHPRPLLPARGGGEVRTLGLVELARDAGHEVMFVQPGAFSSQLWPEGVHLVELLPRSGLRRAIGKALPPTPVRSSVVARSSMKSARIAIRDFDPDVAVVSEMLSWSFARRLVQVPFVYDAHNVERDLLQSLRAVPDSLARKVVFRIDESRARRAEDELLSRAASVLSVSDVEARRLRDLGARGPVVVVSSFAPDQDLPADPASGPPSVLFVGSLNYPPNVAAVTELITAVMPLVRETVPDAELHIVGRKPSGAVTQLADGTDWVKLDVDLPDLGPAYRSARCVVIPMRSGAGTNVKVFEALSYGVPTLGTPQALDGIPVDAGTEVLVEQTLDGLVAATIQLLTDPVHAAAIGAAGYQAFATRLSGKVASAQALAEALAGALNQA